MGTESVHGQDFPCLCEQRRSGLTPQLLLSQQRGVLQQAEETRHAAGHKAMQGAALPRGPQPSVILAQHSLSALGSEERHSAQLLEQLAVSALRKRWLGEVHF